MSGRHLAASNGGLGLSRACPAWKHDARVSRRPPQWLLQVGVQIEFTENTFLQPARSAGQSHSDGARWSGGVGVTSAGRAPLCTSASAHFPVAPKPSFRRAHSCLHS